MKFWTLIFFSLVLHTGTVNAQTTSNKASLNEERGFFQELKIEPQLLLHSWSQDVDKARGDTIMTSESKGGLGIGVVTAYSVSKRAEALASLRFDSASYYLRHEFEGARLAEYKESVQLLTFGFGGKLVPFTRWPGLQLSATFNAHLPTGYDSELSQCRGICSDEGLETRGLGSSYALGVHYTFQNNLSLNLTAIQGLQSYYKESNYSLEGSSFGIGFVF